MWQTCQPLHTCDENYLLNKLFRQNYHFMDYTLTESSSSNRTIVTTAIKHKEKEWQLKYYGKEIYFKGESMTSL